CERVLVAKRHCILATTCRQDTGDSRCWRFEPVPVLEGHVHHLHIRVERNSLRVVGATMDDSTCSEFDVCVRGDECHQSWSLYADRGSSSVDEEKVLRRISVDTGDGASECRKRVSVDDHRSLCRIQLKSQLRVPLELEVRKGIGA